MTEIIPIITEEDLKRILITGCNLHRWYGKNNNSIQNLITEMGFVQLDPLNPAGKYHDIFFFARIPDYSIGQFEKVVYPEKLVFETYFHNLNAISIEHFPFFYSYSGKEHLGRYYTRLLKNLEKISGSDLLEEVYKYVKSNGATQSSDLASLGKADPMYASWKSNRNSGTALELLWAMGKLAIVGWDKNFRKIYNIIEHYIKKDLIVKKNFSETERALYRLKLKLRSFPVIFIGKIAQTGQDEIKSNKKLSFPLNSLLDSNNSCDRYTPILVKLDNDNGYIVPSNWESLSKEPLDSEMRVIGPLDPVIWDRDQLKHLFDFDYVWEVYKKVQDRIWGYYVYPLLYNGEFIGRLEAKLDKKAKALYIFNFRKEKNFDFDNLAEERLCRLLIAWKKMVRAEQLECDATLPIKC